MVGIPLLLASALACSLVGSEANVLERIRRQYGTDEYDPVTGAQIGECTFYGDYTADCSGRLTCRPSDVEDRPTTASLDRTCPKESDIKSGRWDRDQVVPSNMIPRDAGSGRICKCQFYANRGAGNFKCTSVNGDTWKGTHTGSLNTAFKLGLSQTSFGTGAGSRTEPTDRYGSNDRYGTGRGQTGDDRPYTPSNDRDNYGTGTGTGTGTGNRDRYGTTGRDDYSGNRYSTGVGAGERDRDNDVNTRYQTYGSTGRDRDRGSTYPQTTSSEVVMCTYTSEGKGKCRDCTERIDRKETTTEIRTTKHYTCSGPESKTTWTEDNGIMQAGIRPDRYAYTPKLTATCIFNKGRKTFDCHGSSTDGNCSAADYGTSGSRYGSDSSTPQRCLGGEKWSGTYSGAVY